MLYFCTTQFDNSIVADARTRRIFRARGAPSRESSILARRVSRAPATR